jgi:hypothetical protein
LQIIENRHLGRFPHCPCVPFFPSNSVLSAVFA